MSLDADRAQSLLGDPGLAWFVERCRQRLARGRPLRGTVALVDASPAQRDAVDRLLGRRPTSGASLRLDLDDVAEVLSDAGIADRLVDAITAVTGPVTDLAAERAAEERAWTDLFDRLVETSDPGLEALMAELRDTGLLRRLSAGDVGSAERLADQTLGVLRLLPADGLPLARFAATALRDSHALDPGEALSTLVLRGIEHLTGQVRADRSAHERRALWARVGVLCDELSGAALVLGLRATGDGPTDRMLTAAADAGEPLRLTLRQLVRTPPRLPASPVWVCENPAVVASAADQLGSGCPPLVCTDGQPSGAVQTLLRQLATCGASLRVHADVDWGGIRIANLVLARFGGVPWRMGAEDYRAAPAGAPLRGSPVEASWDPTLAAAITDRGSGAHEEQVLDTLLVDLAGEVDAHLRSSSRRVTNRLI